MLSFFHFHFPLSYNNLISSLSLTAPSFFNSETLIHSKSKSLNSCTSFTEYTEDCGESKMPNITLSIPEELKKQLNSLPELNISESVRVFLSEKAKRALLLKDLDKMLEKSELTEEDCLKLGNELKERVWKRHKQEGW